MSGDGMMDIVVGSDDGYLWCIDGEDGALLWRHLTGSLVDSSPAVVDLEDDGYLEIVFGSFDGSIYCLNAQVPVPPAEDYAWPKFRRTVRNAGML